MYEIHITVEPQDDFEDICKANGLKALIIKDDSGSNGLDQMMTAKFFKGEKDGALSYMNETAALFNKVIRRKLEIISKTPVDCLYREYHSKFAIEPHQEDDFKKVVENVGAHFSRNLFRPGFFFMTTRSEEHNERALAAIPFSPSHKMREFVLYDDNPDIDVNWKCDCPIKELMNVSA